MLFRSSICGDGSVNRWLVLVFVFATLGPVFLFWKVNFISLDKNTTSLLHLTGSKTFNTSSGEGDSNCSRTRK